MHNAVTSEQEDDLETVSLTINLSVLQPKTPRKRCDFLGYRLPSSTIKLPYEPFSIVSVAERGFPSHAMALYGFGVIGVALPLTFDTSVADLHWGKTYWCTCSPIRLDDFALCKLRAVGDTTRCGDVAIDRGHIDPVRNGDVLRPWVTVTTLTDGKDTVKC